MDQRDSQERFPEEDATVAQQWQALSLNNQWWFTRCARARSKEAVCEEGIMWPTFRRRVKVSPIVKTKMGPE